jgi:hypothetical protein
MPANEPRFILWSTRDGAPRCDDGVIVSDGVVGRIGPDNVYLCGYAQYPSDTRPLDLAVGECIRGVQYSLSGSSGIYDVYRVA